MPPHLPLRFDTEELYDLYDPGAVSRGTKYATEGRVSDLRWSADGLQVMARCAGSGGRYYQVVADFEDFEDYISFMGTACTCPVGYECKHGVAVLLTARSQSSGTGELALPFGELPSLWRSMLTELAATTTPEADELAPLGIQFELPKPEPWQPTPSPIMRLVTIGKRGTWVRTGVGWREVGDSHDTTRFGKAQVAAIRAIRRAVFYTYSDSTIVLASTPADIWDLLADARDAGVAFVAHKSLDADAVELIDTSRVGLQVLRDESGVWVQPRVQVGGEAWLDGTRAALFGDPAHGLYAFRGTTMVVGRLDPSPAWRTFETLFRTGGVQIPDSDLEEFASDLLPTLAGQFPMIVDDGAVAPPEVDGPRALLHINWNDLGSRVNWRIAYDVNGRRREFEIGVPAPAAFRDSDAEDRLLDEVRPWMERVAEYCGGWYEQAHAYAQLNAADWRTLVSAEADEAIGVLSHRVLARGFLYTRVEAAVLTAELLDALREAGIEVEVTGSDSDEFRAADSTSIAITNDTAAENDWLDLSITVDVDGRQVPLVDVLREVASGASHMLLPDGTYFRLDTPELRKLADLIEEARALGELDGTRVSKASYNVTLWEELLELGVVDEQLASWQERLQRIASARLPEPADPPATLHAELRDYQAAGLDWLRFLRETGLGGILADDMGLGKTVQTLALIASAVEEQPDATFLVIAPTSVISNWVAEAQRFVPDIGAVAMTATGARSGVAVAEYLAKGRIVVTSYALLRLDFDALDKIDWTAVIFDEAQFVKNHNSKGHQCARRLGAQMKLAITGTPMENNLMELWSLLSLTAPGLFPSPKAFTEHFAKPIENGSEPDRLAVLRRRIRPVMLRRTKTQVIADLPPKQEQVLSIDLVPKHDKLYQTRLNRERQKVLKLIDDYDENRFAIFRSLTMLRQLSLHAGLVDEKHADVASAKIEYLAEQLPELVAEGHSALVFSSFTGFLGLIEQKLTELGIEHSYLDGSMSARQRVAAIKRFTGKETKVFLISLKAGGFGLNLTEADYCFVCDPWWNPAAEAQAVDRAHRIGQTRAVTVYRLVSAGTIEEKVVELQDRKRDLFRAVVDDGDLFGSAITADDVRALLDPPLPEL